MDQNKLKFARNCKRAEIGFKNRKKLLKDSAIAFIFPAIFAIIMSILLNPLLLGVLIFEVLLYGSFATYTHLCNRDDIKKCNVGTTNFTYKDYKQMKKSGELARTVAIDNVEEMIYVMPMTNVLREDVRKQNFAREDLLKGAPERSDDSWQVPRLVK